MRIAQVSAHTSPLAPLGGREPGGMNVYVLELSRELARLGYEVDIFTRRDGELPRVEQVAPNLRLVRIDAGPAMPIEKEEIVESLPDFARNMRQFVTEQAGGDGLVHTHSRASGGAGAVPPGLLSPALGGVKTGARFGEEEPKLRIRHERTIARRATAIVTASDHERLLLERYYGADPSRMETIPCGAAPD